MTWSDLWPAAAISIFAWWFSTGLILLLVRLPRPWHLPLLFAATSLVGAAIWGLLASRDNETAAGAYCGFLCALLIWGWHEASFLMGIITGPRPQACPEGISGWRRFGYATATLIYHELALFATLLGLVALTWQAPNQIGAMTFGLLFVMRLSAKFNIFFGVPNLTEEFFPSHLEHLKSYLPKRPMNPLMVISLLASAALAVWLWQQLGTVAAGSGQATALVIVFTLTCLGIIEHIFMITPLPDSALWRWALPSKNAPFEDTAHANPTSSPELKKPENA